MVYQDTYLGDVTFGHFQLVWLVCFWLEFLCIGSWWKNQLGAKSYKELCTWRKEFRRWLLDHCFSFVCVFYANSTCSLNLVNPVVIWHLTPFSNLEIVPHSLFGIQSKGTRDFDGTIWWHSWGVRWSVIETLLKTTFIKVQPLPRRRRSGSHRCSWD